MNITTKYNIGDRVWVGTTRWRDESISCPECEYGYIKITLSTGKEDRVKCPVCYGRGRDQLWDFYPVVQELTIGSVRYDSAAPSHEQFSYMCVETGVGTGSVWYEPLLFLTKEEAEQGAAIVTKSARERMRQEEEARKQHARDNY